VAQEVADTGGIRNHYGRFIPVDLNKPYVGVNYHIQGTAADLIKKKMLLCHQRLKETKSHMLLQVHDELIFEVHQSDGVKLIRELGKIMEEPDEFLVPLTVSCSIGKSWGEKKALAPVRSAPLSDR
jgi:DNA polymerase I-like protein with 3'-5' exonuclease and polymerase domains